MSTSILHTLTALGFSAVLIPTALLAQGCITATIPFSFTAGEQSLQPGEYCLRPVGPGSDVLLIRDVNRRSATVTMTIPGDAGKQDGTPLLTFKHYGDDYFLYQVSDSSRVWQLHQSKAERELVAQKARPNPVSVAASLSSKR